MCAFDVSQVCIHLVSYRQQGKAHQAVSVLKGCDSVLGECVFQIIATGWQCVYYGLCVQSVTVRSAEDERKDRSCVCHRH